MDERQGAAAQGAAVKIKKKRKKGELFKRVVSLMIALVTIAGALVAWRANQIGSAAGDLDSAGLLAVQNAQEVNTVSYVTADQHLIAYTDYVRSLSQLVDTYYDEYLNKTNVPNSILYELITWYDLATTSKRYFFEGKYLNEQDTSSQGTDGQDRYAIIRPYDFAREVGELQAASERAKDIHPEKSFTQSDQLSAKVLGMLTMLVVLAVSLWLFALAEMIMHPLKYVLALGGLIYLFLGGGGALAIDAAGIEVNRVLDLVWLLSWIGGAVLLAAAVVVLIIALAGRGRRTRRVVATAPVPQQPAAYMSQGYDQNPTPVYVPTTAITPPDQAPPAIPAVPLAQVAVEEEDEEDKEEPFKQFVTVLITTVALIAAVIAYVQTDANSQAGSANRNVQQYSLNALGTNTYGAAEMSFHYGTAAYAWKQLDILAKSADKEAGTATGDEKTLVESRAKAYRAAMDNITRLSTSRIFDKEFFDPQTMDVPDQYAFAVFLYRDTATEYSERAAANLALNNAWSTKASTYITHLTLLAVALALFGLALANAGLARYVFVGAGLILVVVTVIWASNTYMTPVKGIKEEAITAFAKGTGFEYQGKNDEAIAAFDEALQIEPEYANALYERGNTYLTQNKYDEAIADFLAAQQAGKDDVNVAWQLGWTYYLQGKYNEAINVDQHGLQMDPTVVGLRLNVGLAHLAAGETTEAELEYNTVLARVSDQVEAARAENKVVEPSLWYYLDAGVTDLDNLLFRLEDKEYTWTQAPPKEKITGTDDVYNLALDLISKLKTRTAHFEYTGKPEEGPTGASVDTFDFAAKSSDTGEMVQGSTFPWDTRDITVQYHYKGLQQGQKLLFKVYWNGIEQPQYRKTQTWSGDAEGDGEMSILDEFSVSNVYTVDPGDYIVEMYVDYHLVARNIFTIEQKP